jgi:replicative DNA helicase
VLLLACVLEIGSLKSLEKRNMLREHFSSADGLALYDWVQTYRSEHQMFPTLYEASNSFTGMRLTPPTLREGDTMEGEISRLAREVSDNYVRVQLQRAQNKMGSLIASGADPRLILEAIQRQISKISAPSNRDLSGCSLLQAGPALRDEYVNRQMRLDSGIAYPWPPVQRCTFGMQPGDFVIIFGATKQGKTWAASHLGVECWRNRTRVLYISCEMRTRELQTRLASLIASVSYMEISSEEGIRDVDDERRYIHTLERLESAPTQIRDVGDAPADIICVGTDQLGSRVTTATIKSIAERYDVDMVIADSVYLMTTLKGEAGTDHNVQSTLANELQRLAVDLCKPLVVTTQVNLRRMTSKDADRSDMGVMAMMSFSQQYTSNVMAAFLVGIGCDDDDPERTILYVKQVANRRGQNADAFGLTFNPGKMAYMPKPIDPDAAVRRFNERAKRREVEKLAGIARRDPRNGVDETGRTPAVRRDSVM